MGTFTLRDSAGGSALRDGDTFQPPDEQLVGALAISSTVTGGLSRAPSLAGTVAVSSTSAGYLGGEPLVGSIEITTGSTSRLVRDTLAVGTISSTLTAEGSLTGGGIPLNIRPIREKPPLRLHYDLQTPGGKHYRWGADEPDPTNIPKGGRDSSTMPGGFESLDVVLPRKPEVDYADIDRLSTLRAIGAGGEVACEARLERAPRVSGSEMAVSPGCVGWQAHLEDDKSAREIYVARELSGWKPPGSKRQIEMHNNSVSYHPSEFGIVETDPGELEAIITVLTGPWARWSASEAWYDAGEGQHIGQVYATWQKIGNINPADAAWRWLIASFGGIDGTGITGTSGNLRAAGPAAVTYLPSQPSRYLQLYLDYNIPAGNNGERYGIAWRDVTVYGNHGIPLRGSVPQGVFASDVVPNVLRRWAPLLNFSEGSDGTIRPSGFVIPHLAFLDRTTAGEIIRQATRFGLQDWGVWEDRTFWWHERGARGRKWRARTGQAQLEEMGAQVDRLWNSVIVQYQDAGIGRTVGPPGSGAETEDASLRDDDPENPANRLGIKRRDLLKMNVSTPAGAIEVGRRFLEEQRQLDRSGKATLVGHVEDDRGVLHPYWKVRAGDEITFVDSHDPSPRRIVRAEHSHDARTCSVDLDAPPEGLQALLERLGVVLVPLGL